MFILLFADLLSLHLVTFLMYFLFLYMFILDIVTFYTVYFVATSSPQEFANSNRTMKATVAKLAVYFNKRTITKVS